MSYIVTRAPHGKGAPAPVPPLREDGARFDFAMAYAGGSRICWADDVAGLVAALAGVYEYEAMGPQDALVARIRTAIRAQVLVQAEWVSEAMLNGDFGRCTEVERGVLTGRRDRQPRGWSTDLLGHDYWSAPVPLVLVTTGWWAEEHLMPVGEPGAIHWLNPLTDDDLLDSMEDLGLITCWATTE
ncbi:hypothetical protein [Nocardioides salarius]|nr:hypothetical protein [Nocardioides salarius]